MSHYRPLRESTYGKNLRKGREALRVFKQKARKAREKGMKASKGEVKVEPVAEPLAHIESEG